MLRCIVAIYGLTDHIPKQSSVEVLLKDSPSLGDVVAALRRGMPSLEEEVIRPGEDRLTDYYTLNINGKLYTDYQDRQGDNALSIKDGDRIALLPLSSGG
jgi:molybdopterin converting factor small subunit